MLSLEFNGQKPQPTDYMRPAGPILTVPNLLSFSRVVITIPIALLIIQPGFSESWLMRAIFVILSFLVMISDYLDGYFARKLCQESDLGRVLDTVCDRSVALIILSVIVIWLGFPLWIVIALAVRELVLIVCNILIIKRSGRVETSNIPGKWFITFLTASVFFYILNLKILFWILMFPAAYFAIHSTVLYILSPIRAQPEV